MKANHHSLWTRDTRAQVGIGTMIVFIATILVAATAAAVLIDTSGKLSERSATTGNEATKQVASNLVVKSVTASRLLTSGDMQYLNVTITLAPGAKAVDLSQLKIQYDDGTTLSTLAYDAGEEDSGDDQFNANFTRDADTSDSTMTPGDLVDLQIDLAANTATLGPRESVTIQLLPEIGSPVDASFSAPSTFGTDKFIVLR